MLAIYIQPYKGLFRNQFFRVFCYAFLLPECLNANFFECWAPRGENWKEKDWQQRLTNYISVYLLCSKKFVKNILLLVHLLSLLRWNWWACSSALPINPCRTFSNQVCPGAPPAAATPAVQPPCQHTRHLSDHFRASTLPKGAGRRECHISLNNSRNLNKLVVFNEKICF